MLSSIRPLLQLADGPTPAEIAAAFRRGEFNDRAFDRYLPEPMSAVSSHWWTPLAIAHQIGSWLDEHGIRSILDIGAGVGKFCVATALAGRVTCIGLEHRARFVGAARDLARIFEVGNRVRFIHGALGERPLPTVDAFYLYNPFGENLFGDTLRLDRDVELNLDRFLRDVAAIEALLRQAPAGFHVVTFNGFGGRIPAGYEQLHFERRRTIALGLWRKRHAAPTKSRIAFTTVSG